MLQAAKISIWLGVLVAASAPLHTGLPVWVRCLIAIASVAYALTTSLLLRRRRSQATIVLFLWGMTLAILAHGALADGVRTPTVIMLPITVVLTGWALGDRHAFVMSVTALLALSALLVLHWPATPGASGFALWACSVFAITAGTVLAVYLARAQRRLFLQATATEQTLAQQLVELKAAQQSFSTLFRSTPTPVSLTRIADGTYLDVNPAWERISGWRRDEVLGKTSTAIGIWATESGREAWIAELVQRGRIENHLIRFRVRSGEVREFISSGEPMDCQGDACVFASFIDVTDQRAAEAGLRELNAELEARVIQRTQLLETANADLNDTVHLLRRTQEELVQAETLASLGALVAGIAHELNTPLGSSVLIASTLREQVSTLKHELAGGALRRSALEHFVIDADEACALLGSSLQRARDLVTSFKTVATDQSSERRRVFDLAELIDDVIQTLRPGFKHEPMQLETALMPGLCMDSLPGPICQVITNLVQNAVLHGLPQTAGGTLRIDCRALDDARVQIDVRDNGTGIPREHLSRIFDPFFTTRLGAGGSGLGLSIVHSLVTGPLGGAITVESSPGEGTRFSVVLPRRAPPGI